METDRCPTGLCPKGACRCGGKLPVDPVDPDTRTAPEALPKASPLTPSFTVKSSSPGSK